MPRQHRRAITLAEEFVAMIRAGLSERFDPWLALAQDSALPAFRNFARKLDSDHDAVCALALEHRAGRRPDQPPEDDQASDVRSCQLRPPQPSVHTGSLITKTGQEPIFIDTYRTARQHNVPCCVNGGQSELSIPTPPGLSASRPAPVQLIEIVEVKP